MVHFCVSTYTFLLLSLSTDLELGDSFAFSAICCLSDSNCDAKLALDWFCNVRTLLNESLKNDLISAIAEHNVVSVLMDLASVSLTCTARSRTLVCMVELIASCCLTKSSNFSSSCDLWDVVDVGEASPMGSNLLGCVLK